MTDPNEIEKLIRTVTDLVLARLEGSAPEQPQEQPMNRRIVLLLPTPSGRLRLLAGQVDELLRRSHPVSVFSSKAILAEFERCGSKNRARPRLLEINDDSISGLLADLSPRDPVVLGTLGFSFSRGLSDLFDADPLVRLVSQALLLGNPVLAVSDDLLAGPGAGRSELAHVAGRLLRNLAGMGLSLVQVRELATTVERIAATDGTLSQAAGELLCETDVERLHAAGERRLVLSRRTLVTPLALSRATELDLEIVREA